MAVSQMEIPRHYLHILSDIRPVRKMAHVDQNFQSAETSYHIYNFHPEIESLFPLSLQVEFHYFSRIF